MVMLVGEAFKSMFACCSVSLQLCRMFAPVPVCVWVCWNSFNWWRPSCSVCRAEPSESESVTFLNGLYLPFYSNLENIHKDNRLEEEMKLIRTRQQSKVVKICSIYKMRLAPLDFADQFITEFSEFFSLFFLEQRNQESLPCLNPFKHHLGCCINSCPPSGPGFSPATAPSAAPVAAAPAQRTSLPCSWPAPQQSPHWPWTRTVNISDSRRNVMTSAPCTQNVGEFSLFDFLFGVHFEGLVALLLFFDPGQVVLSTSFQSLFILGRRQEIKMRLKASQS